MRRYRGLLIAAIICVVLGGIYFFITSRQDAATTGYFWVPQQGETITSVELRNEFGTFRFTLESNGRWIVESDGLYRTNYEKMLLFEIALNHFPIKRVLEDQLPSYGLDNPRANVSFTTNKNRTFGFEMGDTTASQSDVYIRDLSSGKVMIASTSTVAQLTGSLAAYRDKEVLTIDESTINRISFYDGSSLVVAVEKSENDVWQLTEPFSSPARQILLNELTLAISKWRVAGFPEHKDFASMGLDPPTRWFDITDETGAKQRLEIGSAASGTTTYVRTGGIDEVVILFTVDLDFSMLTPKSLMFVAPLRTTIEEVQAISISTPTVQKVFTIDHSFFEERIFSGDEEYSLMEFSSVFVRYIGLSADGRDPAPRPDVQPEAVLTTWFTDGNVKALSLLPRDDNSFYMDWGEDIEFYLYRDSLDDLLNRIENLS